MQLIKSFQHKVIPSLSNIKLDRIDHPNGRYYLLPGDDTKYYSVTTVLSDEDDGSLDAWKARVGAREAELISRRAKNRGTLLHKVCEDYVNNVENFLIDVDHFTKDRFSRIKSVLDDNINNVMGVEQKLYSKRLKVAGTTDLFAEFDKIPSIIDYKGSNRRKKAEWIDDYFIQEAVYGEMVKELTGIEVQQLVIIVFVEDEQPQVFKTKKKYWLKKAEERIAKFYAKREN